MIGYALGMGLVIGVVAVAVALAEEGLLNGTRRILPHVNRVSGALLVVAGGYVAYYGWWELRILAGDDPADPIVDAAAAIQGTLASWVARAGAWWALAGLVALTVLGWWVARGAYSRARDQV
jgi:hypothetical protein